MLKNKKWFVAIKFVIFCTIIILIMILIKNNLRKKQLNQSFEITPEIARSREYETVKNGDEDTNVGYVKFDAFFLKDLDGDGNADSIRGTCNEVGKEDTLYMELKVINNGTLKNGVITINGDNFYLNTTIVKDSVISENYISYDTKKIKLKEMSNGTQRLITGIVRSGDYSNSYDKIAAIGNDTTKYSKVNSITFTGTHVADNGTVTNINKTINFNVDWYGTTKSQIITTSIRKIVNEFDELLDEENVNLNFEINTSELDNDLILKANYLEGTIPELNGFKPTRVVISGNNIDYTYDPETNEFKIKREAIINQVGKVTSKVNDIQDDGVRSNTYKFNVTYPREAYDAITNDNDTDLANIELYIPVRTWYEGYNNTNDEFTNPYISNVSETTVTARWEKYQGREFRFDITVGEYSNYPYGRHVVSKEKPIRLYNSISESEKEDYYLVKWSLITETNGSDTVIMKETKNGNEQVSDEFLKVDSSSESMEQLTSNVGIYFTGSDNLLGSDGWIKVYKINDDGTEEIIETFTKENWNKYKLSNPYMYEEHIKHIKVETSSANTNSNFSVFNLKELDDSYIKSNYDRESFDRLEYIKSTLTGCYNNTEKTVTNTAVYEAPISYASISVDKNKISTQETAKNEIIKIKTLGSGYNIVQWTDGIFLVKLPPEIIDVEINTISINKDNVSIIGYDLYEENGSYFIKILTENQEPQNYSIIIDCDITPDPRTETVNRSIGLYAINQNSCDYSKNARSRDIYDVDNDANTTEFVDADFASISLLSPNSILTHQIASNYDSNNSITIAPLIAKTDKNQRTADVEISIANNYSQNITDVKIQGVIPFEGNQYILESGDLGSTFSTWMSNTGIIVPTTLRNIVTVYYSTEEKPTNDITNANNKWTLAENVTNWSDIKTYLIDFGTYEMTNGENYTFTYGINIPQGINYNEISFSEHAIYFSLMTEQGKYATSTSPNKLGFMIAKQYDLEIIKYQQDTNKELQGITFTIAEAGEEDNGQTKITNQNGRITITGLCAKKEYIIKEIKTTNDYKLNEEEIRIYAYLDEQENLYIGFKENDETYTNLEDKYSLVKEAVVVKENGEDYKVKLSLENEVKPQLKIIKIGNESNEVLSNVMFNITGEGINISRATNSNGELNISGLLTNKEYVITETRKQGYYQFDPVKFKILKNNNTFQAQIIEGNIKTQSLEIIDYIPQIILTLENEKIPTYNLEVIKIEENNENKKLKNAEFMLVGEDDNSHKKILTDDEGSATVDNLYQYVNGKDITGKYTLTETKSPNGYSNNDEEISFVVTKNGNNLEATIENQENLTSFKSIEVVEKTVKLTLQDKPLFKLTKTDKDTDMPVPNAKFVIYELDENGSEVGFAKDIKGNYVGTLNSKNQYEILTNENGEITIPLRNGTYRAIEIEAPAGYEKNPEEKMFKISGNEDEEQEIGTQDEYENTLEINYIEDLVDFSNDVLSGNTYSGTKVILKRSLDFTDNNSYRDASNTTTYGDYNLDGNIESIKTELTSGIGFKSIGSELTNAAAGLREKYFSGIFDGQGNEINGLYIDSNANAPGNTGENMIDLRYNRGLFGYVIDGKIKNISVDGRISCMYTTGGIIGEMKNTEVYNCNNNCYITGVSSCGGIIGEAKSGRVENCNNNGIIETRAARSAGIVGYVNSGNTLLIINCNNYGNLTFGSSYCAGIVGRVDSSGTNVENCANYGTLTFFGDKCGGIFARTSSNCKITNCVNYGDIVVPTQECTNIGGIAGELYGGFITQCINYGNIYGVIKYSGGIVGYSSQNVVRCVNYGNVIGGENSHGLGGIGGEFISNVSECANYGDIRGNTYINGIVDYGSCINCYNRGNLYCSDKGVSGITRNTQTVKNTYSTGKIYNAKSDGMITEVYTIRPQGTSYSGELSNSYYLYSVDDVFANYKENTGTQVTEEELGSIEFFDRLNVDDVWLYREGEAPVLKMIPSNAKALSEIHFTNEQKKFKITTEIETVSGTKGGNISGEGEKPYEEVLYNEDSTKEIKMVPDEEYKIIKITINDETYEFEPEDDGTFILPLFQDMLEDKKIVVTFGKIDQLLTINKIDEETNEPVAGAEFLIAPKGQDLSGTLYRSSYFNRDYETGQIYSYNSVSGKHGKTANSYIYLNPLIQERVGRYKVVINASISSEENNDIGWATFNLAGSATRDDTVGRFIYISGEKQAQDYESEVFEFTGSIGAHIVLGYTKNDTIDYGEDAFKINNIKLVNIDTNEEIDVTSSISIYNEYDFKLYNGSYIPTNGRLYREHCTSEYSDSIAFAYLSLSSLGYNGTYYIEIDAKISSEEGKDIGYATIANNANNMHGNNSNIIEFMTISGEQDRKIYTSPAIQLGNDSKYLNIVYSKDSNNAEGEDKLYINSIRICKLDAKQKIITDSNGKAEIEADFSEEYTIDEIKAPNGYILNNERIDFNPSTNGNTLTIQNSKMPRITVNHYLWTITSGPTETKVADSEVHKGELGETYDTNPRFDIEYEIITNRDYFGSKTESQILEIFGKTSLEEMGYSSLEEFYTDTYIPPNSSGVYTDENQVVNYYYKEKTYKLTVEHLLEGTEERVPNKTTGTPIADEVTSGYRKYVDDETTPESRYETTVSNLIDFDKYELVREPENKNGIIVEDTVVRYYYKQKEHKITTRIQKHQEIDALGVQSNVKGGEISGEGEKPYEQVSHGENSVKEIKAIPDEGYEVKSITVNEVLVEFEPNQDGTVTLNKFVNMTEDKDVVVEFRKQQGTVIVHHYIENTSTKIDLKNGTKAEDEVKTGSVGDIYASKPHENAAAKYTVVEETPERASGTFINGEIHVTYYYRELKTEVIAEKRWSDSNNNLRIRPSSVKVNLKAKVINGQQEEDITESVIPANERQVTINNGTGNTNGNRWTYTWSNLPEYTNTNEIIYSVEEVPLEGNLGIVYSANVERDTTNENKYIITNTYREPTEKISYVVNKIWNDNSNANGKRPEKLVLNIYKVGANNARTLDSTYDINTGSETSHTFELNKYDERGYEINYVAEEAEKTANDLYFYEKTGGERQEITLSGKKAYKSEFTNTFTVPDVKITVPVTKAWSDNSNANNKRPTSIKLVLYRAEGTGNVRVTDYTLSTPATSNTQTYTFTNLPKYDTHGNEIVYTVDEEEVTTDDLKFYSKAIQETNALAHSYTITNTFTVPEDKIEIEAEKIWSEENETQRQRRPTSVILKLINGANVVNTDTANSTNSWKVTFSNLAKYDSHGNEIQYRLDEQEVTEGDLKFYTKGTSSNLIKVDDSHYTLSLTNTFTKPDDTIELTATKQWDDENGKDRLNGIRLVLTGNGQRYAQNLTSTNVDPTNSNNWVYTFQSLPKYNNNGEEIVYTLTEEEATSGDLDKYISSIEGYTATNKLILRETSITKTGTEQITSLDGAINYNISYEAKVDKGYNDEVTLTITDTLPYEIDTTKEYNLNGGKYDAGNKKIEWKATYNPETNKVTYKKWEENTWKTDTEVTLGEQTTLNNVITITKNISLVYKELPVNIPNNKITNTVKGKIELTNNVTEEVEETFDTGVNFKRNIIVTKVWKGDTLNIATRPNSATVQLKKGDVIDRAETLNEANNWKVTWLDLPKYDETTRQEIVYTVIESSVPEGYYLEITEEDVTNTGANNLGFVVTNNKYGSIKITKVDKANEEEKLAGAEITLQKLKQEGSNWVVDETVATRTLTTSSETATLGEVTFNNLTYGKYRVKETKAPEGYQLLRSTVDLEITESNPDIANTIKNTKKTVLPLTGGKARGLTVIVGIVVIIYAFKVKRKKSKHYIDI